MDLFVLEGSIPNISFNFIPLEPTISCRVTVHEQQDLPTSSGFLNPALNFSRTPWLSLSQPKPNRTYCKCQNPLG